MPDNATTAVGLFDIETIVPAGAGGIVRVEDGANDPFNTNVNGTHYLRLGLDGGPKREAIVYFPGPIRAWGADYSFNSLTDPAQADFAGFTNNFGGRDATGFIGYLSDMPFSQVTLRDPFISTAFFGLDDISFASAIPEPATGVLLLIATGFVVRRRRHQESQPAR